jgi:hypothetical protein
MTRERRALEYVIEVLRQKYSMVATLGPATDFPQEAEAKCEALEFAAAILKRPYYEVNPFI